jgi:hypothetical protein
MSERHLGWAVLGLGLLFAAPATADDEWAILGHELGCSRVTPVLKSLAEDVPALAKLKPCASPDDFMRQLTALGVHARRRKLEGRSGWYPSGIVVIEIGSEYLEGPLKPLGTYSLAFVKHRECTEFND